jgi:uncharacterized cupredoxin-like copper-binding protein
MILFKAWDGGRLMRNTGQLKATRVIGSVGTLVGASVLLVSTALAAPAARGLAAPKWLSVSASSKTATLTMIGEYNSSNNGYNFDGYSNGKMVVTVPVNWTIKVKCSTAASAVLSHSCVITKGLTSTKPAFPGAGVKNATAGLAPGSKQTFTFVPSKTGTYKINCVVPGHAAAGMWDTLKIVASGSPSINVK